MAPQCSVVVFGPAYLDRVLRVDGPLAAVPLDQSVEGRLEPGPGLALVDAAGRTVTIEPPLGWPGPTGVLRLTRPLFDADRRVGGLAWHDDLGGMGAGFAAAFEAELISALGPEDDPTSQAVTALLARWGVRHRPVRVSDRTADWTLLITSGPHGDKLPVGFRGCHDAVADLPVEPDGALRVVAALPNRLAARVLNTPGAEIRFFAPAMRNMLDRTCPLEQFAPSIDILCCNRREWETLPDPETITRPLALLAITDGPAGSRVRQRGGAGWIEAVVPAFPRARPPRDTNRAGEAYAATLIRTLLETGWSPSRPVAPDTLTAAAVRAAAAAALVLDQCEFGFPTPAQIDAALRAGKVA